jgi:hypothetical protein
MAAVDMATAVADTDMLAALMRDAEVTAALIAAHTVERLAVMPAEHVHTLAARHAVDIAAAQQPAADTAAAAIWAAVVGLVAAAIWAAAVGLVAAAMAAAVADTAKGWEVSAA